MSERIERNLVMINSVSDPLQKNYSVITFEDNEGIQYEYKFAASLRKNSRNKFYKEVRDFEYFPLLQNKNNKPIIRASFRIGKTRFNPITGKKIHQMIYPTFEENL